MSFHSKLSHFINEQHWTLGFIEQPLKDIIDGKPYEIIYVKGMPRDRWFADPFILDYDEDRIQVLVEEFCYKLCRGRIAWLSFDRKSYRLLEYKIILDLPTHLSFPFIQRKNGKVYICPENSASGSWNMYEYNPAADALTKENMVNLPLTDAIITDLFGETVFATVLPNPNGSILGAYSIDGELKQSISFPSNIARNAGDWFVVDNKVYRPSQDCNNGYGRAVILQEVTNENGDFTFKDVRRIASTHPKFTTGCHTFNNYKGLTIVDVHGWRRPCLVKVVRSLKKSFN